MTERRNQSIGEQASSELGDVLKWVSTPGHLEKHAQLRDRRQERADNMSIKEDFVTPSNEQITVRVGADRKKQLLGLSLKTGVQVASLVRSWIFEKLDEAQSCKGGAECR